MDFLPFITRLPFLGVIYAVLCWAFLDLFVVPPVGPGSFFVLFLVSLLLGFFLIVLQTGTSGSDEGDNGAAITMLSGEVIPAIQETPEQKHDDQDIQRWVDIGKPLDPMQKSGSISNPLKRLNSTHGGNCFFSKG